MSADNSKSDGGFANMMPWLDDFKQMVEKYKLPNVDIAALIEWQRKDMEAVAAELGLPFRSMRQLKTAAGAAKRQ